jgi:hypothetical protein
MNDDAAFAVCVLACMIALALLVGLVAGVGHTLGVW